MFRNMIILLIIIFAGLLIAEESYYNNLEAPEFSYRLENLDEEEYTLIDVRTPQEFNAGHIAGAQMIDFYSKDFIEKLAQLPKDDYILIHGHTGRRTGVTLQNMKQLGFQRVDDLKGGIVAWARDGYKLVTE